MIKSLEDTDSHLDIATDICIVGAGVAGQALAKRLAKTSLKVTLLESGGHDFRSDTQELAKGDNIGEGYYPLETARLRMFGGTAAIWGGRCAELDPIDFEWRDWVAHSGWPISKSDLDPYYDDVFGSLGLKRPGEGRLWSQIRKPKPEFDPAKLDTDLWVFDEKGDRFTDLKQDGLTPVDIILNATLTRIDMSEAGEITQISAKGTRGGSATVKARAFILAAGAIETVRLLLTACPERPKGLGNEHDQLGRYFMEHPHARGGQIIPNDLAHALTVLPRSIRQKGKRYAAYLRPSPELQREKGILNTSLSFAARHHEGDSMEMHRRLYGTMKHSLPANKFWRSLWKAGKNLAIRGLEATDPASSILNMKLNRGGVGVYAVIRAEQAPNPESRLVLTEKKDALGMRQVALDWRLLDIDRESVSVLMDTLASEYERLGWGTVKPADWLTDTGVNWKTDPLISNHPIGGYHHMGGTRMSTTSMTGVVDRDCRVHGCKNLYVASSSVFPTGGWANPTITIMALALRLGDHLGQNLS